MHLHNHTNYSVIDGRGLIKDYLDLAEKDGQEAFAITDHGTLGGVIDFYTQAKKRGNVKPIIGMEMYVDAVELKERNYPGHLTILAKNEDGYRALIAANNLAHRQFYYRPRISLQQIIEHDFARDWFILSGCQSSPLYDYPHSESLQIVKQLNEHSAGLFLEFMWHESNDVQFEAKQWEYLERVAAMHKETGLPMVITNDCHYSHPHMEKIHLDMLARKHSDVESHDIEFDGRGFHMRSQYDMEEIARKLGVPNAVQTAVDICKMCDVVIPEADKTNWYVPDITNGRPEETLMQLCESALETRGLGNEYRERYEYELSVLKTSPAILNSYLVTYDVVSWCGERGIPVAARGSMGGSLISWLLGITLEDPIKYRLSFARAVNPARPTIPDFDLDVSSIHRSEILDYLKQRYEGNIPISAYTHYGPKGALRKILKLEGLRDYKDVNELCKTLPDDWPVEGKLVWDEDVNHFSLPPMPEDGESIVEISPRQKRSIVYKPEWLSEIPDDYIDEMAIYEGLYASISVHPSGVLVSGPERQLENEVPLVYIPSSKMLASAFDMYTLKKVGLFKLDVLGLRTLDQLAFMERVSGTRVPNDDYDDPEVLGAFGANLLAEIFQMDGYACREVIKSISGTDTFEDIIAANTLARPGCAQFTPYYRSGYEGLIRQYPDVTDILGPTNGLILYQEQVMEIARVLADFDDAEQDDVKEAIKYFRHEVWSKTIEPKFRERVEAKGQDPTAMLDAIARMASYTYNRAHAMTYAAIAYKMMWYKIHYPAVYYAAVFDDTDDKQRLILESHFFNVNWQPVDINESDYYTTVKGNTILLGLGAVKGVGPAAWETIRTTRPFTSYEDFKSRITKKSCNKNVQQKLLDTFAFSSLGISGTLSAFEECFGFNMRYLDPTVAYELSKFDRRFYAAGFISDLRSFTIAKEGPNKGKEMAQARIMNSMGATRCILFPDVWKRAKGKIYTGMAIAFQGQPQVNGEFIVEHAQQIVVE